MNLATSKIYRGNGEKEEKITKTSSAPGECEKKRRKIKSDMIEIKILLIAV